MSARRRLFILYFIVFTLYGVGMTAIGPCLTSVEATFGLGHQFFGGVLAIGSLGYLSGLLFGIRIARNWPLAWTVWIGAMVQGGSLLCIAASPHWIVFVVGLAGHGFAGGFFEPAWAASMSTLFPDKTRKAMNLTQVGFGIGAVIGPLIGVMVLGMGFSWRWVYVLPGAAAAILLFLTPRREPSVRRVNDGEGDPVQSSATSLLRNPVLWILSIAMMFYVGGELGFSSWSSAFLENERGQTKSFAGFAPLSLWAGILFGRMAMWYVPETISSRRILIIASILSAAFALAALRADGRWVILLCLAGSGFGLGPVWPTLVAHGARRLRNASSRVLSWIILGGGVGSLAQALIGLIAERTSLSTALVFATALILGVVVLLALDRLVERREAVGGG